jgi:hypothetical protein
MSDQNADELRECKRCHNIYGGEHYISKNGGKQCVLCSFCREKRAIRFRNRTDEQKARDRTRNNKYYREIIKPSLGDPNSPIRARVYNTIKNYKKANLDKVSATLKTYYQNNREKILAQQRLYYKNNKEKRRARYLKDKAGANKENEEP